MIADIRVLKTGEIGTLIDWAANEGWNPGLDDARAFQAADPRGFLGAFVDQRMVAGLSVVAYNARFGFLGLYICHPDFRGQGFGRAAWDAGMTYLGSRTVGLDGVPEQQANYRRKGFATEYETIRMTGELEPRPAKSCRIEPLTATAPISDIDRACFPADRQAFLAAWIAPPRRAWFAMRNGEVTGYVVVRACRTGRKIGPLYAHDVETAMDLLGAIQSDVQIDVPMHQAVLLNELEARGFTAQFQTARMYKGRPPTVRLDRVFAVSTLELG